MVVETPARRDKEAAMNREQFDEAITSLLTESPRPVDWSVEVSNVRGSGNPRVSVSRVLLLEVARDLIQGYELVLGKIAERTGSDDPCYRLVKMAREALARGRGEL